jgi:hypothetical protein
MGVGWGGGRLRGGWQPDGPGWILDVGHSVGRGGVAVAPSGVEGGRGQRASGGDGECRSGGLHGLIGGRMVQVSLSRPLSGLFSCLGLRNLRKQLGSCQLRAAPRVSINITS